jgi:hypothetical protein
MPVPHLVSEHLPEALRLLPRARHGRAAVTRRALPYVLLAQHLVDGRDVLLRIPAGQIESRTLDGSVLAYHAHTTADWTEHAPGVQLVGTVTTVRPTPEQRAAFPRAAEDGGAAGSGADPAGTLYARLEPMLAAIRH